MEDSGRQGYEAYIASSVWRETRRRVLERDKRTCPCGRRATDVHHLSYRRFKREHWEDLRAICKPCHDLIHETGARGKQLAVETIRILGLEGLPPGKGQVFTPAGAKRDTSSSPNPVPDGPPRKRRGRKNRKAKAAKKARAAEQRVARPPAKQRAAAPRVLPGGDGYGVRASERDRERYEAERAAELSKRAAQKRAKQRTQQ